MPNKIERRSIREIIERFNSKNVFEDHDALPTHPEMIKIHINSQKKNTEAPIRSVKDLIAKIESGRNDETQDSKLDKKSPIEADIVKSRIRHFVKFEGEEKRDIKKQFSYPGNRYGSFLTLKSQFEVHQSEEEEMEGEFDFSLSEEDADGTSGSNSIEDSTPLETSKYNDLENERVLDKEIAFEGHFAATCDEIQEEVIGGDDLEIVENPTVDIEELVEGLEEGEWEVESEFEEIFKKCDDVWIEGEEEDAMEIEFSSIIESKDDNNSKMKPSTAGQRDRSNLPIISLTPHHQTIMETGKGFSKTSNSNLAQHYFTQEDTPAPPTSTKTNEITHIRIQLNRDELKKIKQSEDLKERSGTNHLDRIIKGHSKLHEDPLESPTETREIKLEIEPKREKLKNKISGYKESEKLNEEVGAPLAFRPVELQKSLDETSNSKKSLKQVEDSELQMGCPRDYARLRGQISPLKFTMILANEMFENAEDDDGLGGFFQESAKLDDDEEIMEELRRFYRRSFERVANPMFVLMSLYCSARLSVVLLKLLFCILS